MITINARLMNEIHTKYGTVCENNSEFEITAVADTGCQTTSAGLDDILKMGFSRECLIPTCHGIIGITDNRLKIVGGLFLEMSYNNKTTRQMVHVSMNSSGFYLSERALIDFGLISPNFPNCTSAATCLVTPNLDSGSQIDEEDVCECIPREKPPERPQEIPYPPTEENVDRIKEWLVSAFKASAFNTCTHQPLNEMTGAPMKIVFKENYTEHRVHTPIEVPHYWKYQVKEDIDKDVRLGIIEPVPQGTPTTWCTRMVVTAKKNGKPRRTVDLQKLKEATLRETHYTPTPFHIVSVTPSHTRKTILDAWNGYHSLPMAEEAKNATTFITEWGRYRYKRAPQGFHASGDAYTRRFDDITVDFKRVSRCIDDSLLWDETIEDAFWHTFDYLRHCSANGIIFNKEKFVFASTTCEYAGFELTPDGYRPTSKMLDSIRNFPTPKNVSDVRSWFGLVNQVAYAFAQSQTMAPFRDHLKDTKFYWDESLDTVFNESKSKIVDLIKDGVKNFEINRPACLATDWSKSGIGFTLSQKYCDCGKSQETKTYSPNCGNGHWKLILAGSRFTKDAESRYAPVEGEALAVAYGLEQCRLFVLGSPDLTIAVDHKPLVRILNDRALGDIENPRLLRLKEKTLPYDFKIIHVPGNQNSAPDAMSRHPTVDAQQSEPMEESLSRSFAVMQGESMPGSISWDTIDNASAHDDECIKLREVVEQGFPSTRNELPQALKKYFPMRDELYIIGRTVFKGKKMLIPSNLRRLVLEGLHAAHQGVTGMKANARERLFWPGMDIDLQQIRSQCKRCNENAPSQADEPMIITKIPELPFQQVCIDYCNIEGSDFLIYADRFTGWTEVAKVPSTSFQTFQKNMLSWFKTYGVPEEIASDGGPPFNSNDYRLFLKKWNIKPRLSSAYYPQSNGRAEAAVKSMKRCLGGNIDRNGSLDNEKVARAIMTHRNTPLYETGLSPAEMLFGFKLRDHLPNKHRSVRKEWTQIQRAREVRNTLPRVETREAKWLSELDVGDVVSVQNQTGSRPKKWGNIGVVVEVLPHRQYRVVLDGSRRITLRNRKFLRKVKPIISDPTHLPKQSSSPPAIVLSNLPSPRQPQLLGSPPEKSVLTPDTPRRPSPQAVPRFASTPLPQAVPRFASTPLPPSSPPTTQVIMPPAADIQDIPQMPPADPQPTALPTPVKSRALQRLADHNKRGDKETAVIGTPESSTSTRRSARLMNK